LIARDVHNFYQKIDLSENFETSVFVFHYAFPRAVLENEHIKAAISDDETGALPLKKQKKDS